MKLHLTTKKFTLSAFSALIAIALLLSFVPGAAAQSEGPITPIPGMGRVPNATLIAMHKKEGAWYTNQEDLLKQADRLAVSFQTLIDAQAKAGKDVTILQTALGVFNSEVAASRAIHLTAGAAVYSLVGFKANGDVRDRLAAGQSLLDGRERLKDAHFRLTYAMDTLRKSFGKWRHARIISPSYP